MSGCIYKLKDGRCDKSGRYKAPCIGEACSSQTPSNYDQIISKTPEKMVKWIMSIEPAACPFRDDHGDDCRFTHCEECWLSWLKSPAEKE